MVKHTELSAVEIAKSALEIAGGICVYTNLAITVEELG
jgi:ATP-dependent HslUV protease subunit HslV